MGNKNESERKKEIAVGHMQGVAKAITNRHIIAEPAPIKIPDPNLRGRSRDIDTFSRPEINPPSANGNNTVSALDPDSVNKPEATQYNGLLIMAAIGTVIFFVYF
jgi:hypothetical protein